MTSILYFFLSSSSYPFHFRFERTILFVFRCFYEFLFLSAGDSGFPFLEFLFLFFRIFRFSGLFFNLYFCFRIWFRSVKRILRPFVSFSGFSFSEIFYPYFRFFFFPEISVLNMALKGFSFYKTDFVQLFSSGKVFMIFLFYHLFFFRLMFTLDFVFLDSGS
jgi:hypothetical protein